MKKSMIEVAYQVLTNNNSRFIIKTIEQKKQVNKNNRTKKENKIEQFTRSTK